MTGQRIAHFEVLEKLGEGGMGVVYKARDLDLNRFVALKMLPASLSAHADRRQRFLQEAQAASALNHPNIVTVYEIFREGGSGFIAMEFLHGRTLQEVIGTKGLKLEAALRIAEQIAAALAAAHGAGIVHRDLKPANIMVSGDDQVKVLDFGLAKLADAAPDDATQTYARAQTEAGTILGTLAYMSPEQAEGKLVDWRSDIFSFGTVLYEMVTGRRAFQGEGRLQTISAVIEKDPPPVSESTAAAPRELQRLIARCLKKKPAERSQSMVDVKYALEELRTEIASGQISGIEQAPAKKSRWPLAAALAIGAVVLVGGSALAVRWREPAPVVYTAKPFTTYPGQIRNPSLSLDGKFVAFSWNGTNQDNEDIYVRRVGAGDPLRLTQNPERDSHPAWSPNGDYLAFYREGPLESGGLYVVPAIGGPERRVLPMKTALYFYVRWTPDGRSLILSRYHWLSVVQVDSGEETRLTLPFRRTTHHHILNPEFSPNGQELAFIVKDVVLGDSIHIVPWSAAGKTEGSSRQITTGRLGSFLSLTWCGDGNHLYVADRGGGIPRLFRVSATADSTLEMVAGFGEHVAEVSISGSLLVYRNELRNADLERVTIDAGGNVGPDSVFLKSTRSERFPRFSPDGKEIGLISDRSGGSELWIADAGGSNLRQITQSAPVSQFSWAPDSSELIYSAEPSAGRMNYRIRRQGGNPRVVGPPGAFLAQWTPDAKSIYFSLYGPGESEVQSLYRVAADGSGESEILEGTDGGGAGGTRNFLSGDGQEIWEAAESYGLTRRRLPAGEPVVVAAKNGVRNYAAGTNGVHFIEVGSSLLQFCRFSDGKIFDIAKLPASMLAQPGGLAPNAGFTVSPDGKILVYTKSGQPVSDLYLVEGMR